MAWIKHHSEMFCIIYKNNLGKINIKTMIVDRDDWNQNMIFKMTHILKGIC